MIIDCFSLFGFINLWLLSISLYTLYSGRIEDFWQKYSPFFLWSGPQLLHSQVWFCRQWCMLTIGTVEGCPFFSRVVSLNFLWLLRNFPTIRISALCANFWCWWCCCVTLLPPVEVVWFFFEDAGEIFIFLCSSFRYFEVFLNVLNWLD